MTNGAIEVYLDQQWVRFSSLDAVKADYPAADIREAERSMRTDQDGLGRIRIKPRVYRLIRRV